MGKKDEEDLEEDENYEEMGEKIEEEKKGGARSLKRINSCLKWDCLKVWFVNCCFKGSCYQSCFVDNCCAQRERMQAFGTAGICGCLLHDFEDTRCCESNGLKKCFRIRDISADEGCPCWNICSSSPFCSAAMAYVGFFPCVLAFRDKFLS